MVFKGFISTLFVWFKEKARKSKQVSKPRLRSSVFAHAISKRVVSSRMISRVGGRWKIVENRGKISQAEETSATFAANFYRRQTKKFVAPYLKYSSHYC
jgi:hypothetical protein